MPERIRKASSTTERSRRFLSKGGGRKTVTKTKSVDSQGNTLKKRTVTKSAEYKRRLNLGGLSGGFGAVALDRDPRTQTKTSIKEKLADGSVRKVKTRTLQQSERLGRPDQNKGRQTNTITKEKVKTPGSKVNRRSASETISRQFISGRPMPDQTKNISLREGRKSTKFKK